MGNKKSELTGLVKIILWVIFAIIALTALGLLIKFITNW